jgi:hypothetical protein
MMMTTKQTIFSDNKKICQSSNIEVEETKTIEIEISENRKKIPFMECEDPHNVKIKCQSITEAEQRARIHMAESKGHKAIWRYE